MERPKRTREFILVENRTVARGVIENNGYDIVTDVKKLERGKSYPLSGYTFFRNRPISMAVTIPEEGTTVQVERNGRKYAKDLRRGKVGLTDTYVRMEPTSFLGKLFFPDPEQAFNRTWDSEKQIDSQEKRFNGILPALGLKTIGENLAVASLAAMFVGLPIEAAALFGNTNGPVDPTLAKIFLGTLVGGTVGVFLGNFLSDN